MSISDIDRMDADEMLRSLRSAARCMQKIADRNGLCNAQSQTVLVIAAVNEMFAQLDDGTGRKPSFGATAKAQPMLAPIMEYLSDQ